MAGLFKRLSMSPTGHALLAWGAVQYLRAVKVTNRWEQKVPAATAALLDDDKPVVACFWHGRLAVMRPAWRRSPSRFHMLISGHRDGEVVAIAMRRLGFPVISGSSRRGGTSALRAMSQVLWRGDSVGITPDGPRGPRMRAKLGAIKAAQAAGVPIVPVTGSIRRCRVLKTWDRFLGADFFSRGLLLFGEPIEVPKGLDRDGMEAKRLELETVLNDLTREADLACGLEPVEPAPPGAAAGNGKPANGHGAESQPATDRELPDGLEADPVDEPERLAGAADHARP